MNRKLANKLSVLTLTVASAVAVSAQTPNTTASATPATGNAGAAPVAATGVGKIAIINIQQAIVATNEGRRDFEALNKKFDPKQSELKAAAEEIDRLKKDLSANTEKLSEDERAKRVQAIDAKQKLLQRNAEDAQNDYQQQSNEVGNRIGGKLMEVMDKYARQNGIGVVIDVSSQYNSVLWGSEQANITAPVVEAYNAQSGVAAPTPNAPRPTTTAPHPTTAPRTTPKPGGSAATPKQ